MFEAITSNLYAIFVFIVFLGILVTVHEWGHFITAKKLGIKVEEFALGFGPMLFSKVVDETAYSVRLFPLGGFVKMAGDDRAKLTGDPREFYSKPVGHRALVVLNGPMVNFALAYLCLWIVFMIGYPEMAPKIGELKKDYPAQQAGLMVGDRIQEIDNQPIESWDDLQNGIAKSTGETIDITVLRNDERIQFSITPKIEKAKTIFGEMKERRFVGLVPAEEIISLRYGPVDSLIKAGQKFWYFTVTTYKALFAMVTGAISAKENVGGPIFIFTIVKNAAAMGINHLIFLLGIISLNLAIFNLLPVIPLDGGHLFLFGVEKLRRKPLSANVDTWIANVGFSLIILLAIFVFYLDFDRVGAFNFLKKSSTPNQGEVHGQ